MKYKIYIIEQREVYVPDNNIEWFSDTLYTLREYYGLPLYNTMEEAIEVLKNVPTEECTYTILPIFKHEK